MTRVSLTTALASLFMFYGTSDALAVSHDQNSQSDLNIAAARQNAAERRVSTAPSIDIGGILASHGWTLVRGNYYHTKGVEKGIFPSEYLKNYGFSTDGMVYITAEGSNDVLGVSYGANVELNVPNMLRNYHIHLQQIGVMGAGVFVNTRLGDLKVGYQEGIDSVMRIDAFSIGAGDNSNLWMRYVNLKSIHDPLDNIASGVDLPIVMNTKYLENAFYLSTGLYSESIYEGSNRFSRGGKLAFGGTPNLVNELPFRFSYLSPSVGGLRIGVSYSPFGYDEDKVVGTHVTRELVAEKSEKKSSDAAPLISNAMFARQAITNALWGDISLPVREKNTRPYYIMPLYEHVVNVGMTYSGSLDGIDFKISAVSEYAKNKTQLSKERVSFARMDDIKNIAFGGMLSYKNLKFAASYGYLGSIDGVNNMHNWNGEKFALDGDDRILIQTSGTYFWTLGGGYEYRGAYVSAAYRGSSYSGNKFNEIALGAEYDISTDSSRVSCAVFANYHYFHARSAVTLNSAETNGVNKGQVALAGVKVMF
ncbi:MAG: porin [Anaplasma sp.]